jgi:hypothetical protein
LVPGQCQRTDDARARDVRSHQKCDKSYLIV